MHGAQRWWAAVIGVLLHGLAGAGALPLVAVSEHPIVVPACRLRMARLHACCRTSAACQLVPRPQPPPQPPPPSPACPQVLGKLCGAIASDESRHEIAYTRIVDEFFR